MAKAPQAFSLPEEGRRSLNHMLKKGTHAARELTRARILLKLDQGLGPAQVAREVGTCQATVYNVRDKANQHGYKLAVREPRKGGRPNQFSGKTRAEITALACSKAPKGHAQWSLRLLSDRAVELEFTDAISHETIRRILKKQAQAAPEETVVPRHDHG